MHLQPIIVLCFLTLFWLWCFGRRNKSLQVEQKLHLIWRILLLHQRFWALCRPADRQTSHGIWDTDCRGVNESVGSCWSGPGQELGFGPLARWLENNWHGFWQILGHLLFRVPYFHWLISLRLYPPSKTVISRFYSLVYLSGYCGHIHGEFRQFYL